jgi:hypothetical protein
MVQAARRRATGLRRKNYKITLFLMSSGPKLGREELWEQRPPDFQDWPGSSGTRFALMVSVKGSGLWRRFWNIPAGSTVIRIDASISENTVKGLGATR